MTRKEALRAALLEYVRQSTPKPAGYGDYPSVTRKHDVSCESDADEIMRIVIEHFPEVATIKLEVTYQAGFFGRSPAWVLVDKDTRLVLDVFPVQGRSQADMAAAKKKAKAAMAQMMKQVGGAE